MSEPELRRALARREAPPHPAEPEWERFATGETTAAERDALVDHALACAPCARTLLALEHLAAASGRRTVLRPAPRPHLWAPLALAAGLGLAVVGGWWLGRAPTAEAPAELRAGEAPLPALEVVTPVGEVARGGLAFRWRPVAGAADYSVRVFRADGVPFGAVGDASLPVLDAGAIAADWPAGGYVWRVEARRDGELVAGSRLVDFELVR